MSKLNKLVMASWLPSNNANKAVIPAQAGIQKGFQRHWIPAFAGMTKYGTFYFQGNSDNQYPKL
jgi:hypothetical protein